MARRASEFLTTSKWMSFWSSSPRSSFVVFASMPTQLTNTASSTPSSRRLDVAGHEIFDVFTHQLGFTS